MRLIILVGLALAWSCCARAAEPASPAGVLCSAAIDRTERSLLIPDGLLRAIGRVETGVPDPAIHQVVSWPWTIDVGGTGHFFASKEAAVAAVAAMQAEGVRSIDVGCLQVNLMHHPAAFANLDQAFDPAANVLYAGQFLRRLYTQTASWSAAAAAYHSQTPSLGLEYRRRVLAEWGVRDDAPAPAPPARTGGTAYGAFAPAAAVYAAFAPKETIYAAFPPADTVYGAFAVPAAPSSRPVMLRRAGAGLRGSPVLAGRQLADLRPQPAASASRQR